MGFFLEKQISTLPYQYHRQHCVRNAVQKAFSMKRLPGENALSHLFYCEARKFSKKTFLL